MADITYICKRTVVSTKPVQPGKYCPLSVLDRLMEQNHLMIVYYYRCPAAGEREAGEVTKKLRESISDTLTHFPIMTGRLQKTQEGHWMVKCNDAGVRMVEARAKGSVEEWLQSVDREKELKLVHWEDMFHQPYFWSTFYVQLTEFEGGGLSIGLSCIHLLADPICTTMFIKAWASITLTGKIISPPIFHPLPSPRPGNKNPNHTPYTHLINHYKSLIQTKITPLMNNNNIKHTTITLGFPHLTVQAIMAMAQTVSPFEALSALFWVCVSKVKGLRHGLLNMSICLDMRKALGLDKGFFGNCMVYNKVHAEKNSFSGAARAIGDVVAKMDTDGIVDVIDWLKSNNDHHHDQTLALMNDCDHLVCTNLEGLVPCLTIFEDGFAPIRASYYVEPVVEAGQILIFQGKALDEGPLSRVVMATLAEEDIVKLCEDDLIKGFSPAILMGLSKNHGL